MNDAGNYTCTANNSLATVTSNLSLTVHSKNFTINDYCMTIHNAEPGLVFVYTYIIYILPYIHTIYIHTIYIYYHIYTYYHIHIHYCYKLLY